MDIRKKIKEYFVVLLTPLLFLIIGIVTIPDYGINWDEPFHFNRGQAYLHFFLTGEKNFHSLPPYKDLKGSSDYVSKTGESDLSKNAFSDYKNGSWKRSYFQSDIYNFEYLIENENGHPPTADILSALSNYIFFQKMGIMDDLDSHHLSEVVISFFGLLAVAYFVYIKFGLIASVFTSLSIALYPLFFSESHFNIKDPAVASFMAITIIFFYMGITQKKYLYLIISSISLAFGVGTKFNALAIPLIVIPWFVFYIFNEFKKQKDSFLKFIFKNKGLYITLAFYPLIFAGVFYLLWPFIWKDTFSHLKIIFDYYRQIGSGTPPELSRFIFKGWNLYAPFWILVTTPLTIIFFGVLGVFSSLSNFFKKKDDVYLLILLWLGIPIFRVMMPESAIYGGVRQIMEFVFPLGILTGIGVKFLLNKYSRQKELVVFSCILAFSFTFYELYKIHPNQNVYFNQIIGGLSGAKKKNIPYWGNSYGNAYLQGVNWLNENAEEGAKLGLPIANMVNIPRTKLRPDIDFSNAHWSGPDKKGEYEIELDFDWAPKSWYSYAYYDVFLNPVFEAKVDGESILKVWKNDLAHTKPGFEKEVNYAVHNVKKEIQGLTIDLGKEISLTRITIEHDIKNCSPQKGGYISISSYGKNWIREPEAIDYPQVPPAAVGIDEDTFVFLFAAKKARFLYLDAGNSTSCLLKTNSINIKGLPSANN